MNIFTKELVSIEDGHTRYFNDGNVEIWSERGMLGKVRVNGTVVWRAADDLPIRVEHGESGKVSLVEVDGKQVWSVETSVYDVDTSFVDEALKDVTETGEDITLLVDRYRERAIVFKRKVDNFLIINNQPLPYNHGKLRMLMEGLFRVNSTFDSWDNENITPTEQFTQVANWMKVVKNAYLDVRRELDNA